MNNKEDEAYIMGATQARVSMIRDCLIYMHGGNDSIETICGRLQAENLEMKNAIRDLYDEMDLPYYNEGMSSADLIRQIRRLTVKDRTP